MAQSIQIDIKGNAGSLLKALKQSETAMSKLAQSTNRLSGVQVKGSAVTNSSTQSVVANSKAVTQNTDAQNRSANAARNNASAQQSVGNSLAATTSRLGQANAGFYNIGFAIEDAGQFANGFSAGMRAIGNNLSAIALSLSASGAKFSDFLGFLRGPGGLIIAISAFTAAAQLVPPLLEKMDGLFGGVGKSAKDSAGGISGAADQIDRVGNSALDSADDLEELRSAFAEFIKLRDESAEFAEIGIDEARRRVGILEAETAFLSNQKALAEAALRAKQGIARVDQSRAPGVSALVEKSEEQLRFESLTAETLQRIIAESEEELLIIEAQTEEMREQVRSQEARERVQQRLDDQGFKRKEVEEGTAKSSEFQLTLKQKLLMEQDELNRQIKEEAESSKLAAKFELKRLKSLEELTLRLQSAAVLSRIDPPEVDTFVSAFERVQERVEFADFALSNFGVTFDVFDIKSQLSELEITVDVTKSRFAILADQIESAFDRGIISAAQFQEFLARAEESVFGSVVFDGEEERIDAQTKQLASSFASGMAGFASAIISGEQTVGSAFASFLNMMGDQLIRLGITNIALGAAGEALRKFVSNPATAIAAGAALIGIGGILKRNAKKAQSNILSGSSGGISSGYSFNRNQFAMSSSASVGYIAPPPPPSNPYAEIRMDAKDFVVSFDDARRELDVVT